MKQKTALLIMVISAFTSIISACMVNSASADKHQLNGFWIGLAVVAAITAAGSAYLALKAKK